MMTNPRYGEPIVPDAADGRLTLAELQRAVRDADPAAFLVPPRIVRRAIKDDCHLTGFGLKVPHRKSYAIARDSLLDIVDRADLGLSEDDNLPEWVILLARPSSQDLLETPAGDLLTRCWRLLFHARVHLALEAKLAAQSLVGGGTAALSSSAEAGWISGSTQLTAGQASSATLASQASIRRRIHEIGTVEFDEIRAVLAQENLLLPPQTDQSTYIEFAATYLELRHFAASFLSRFFPCLEDLRAIDGLLAQDVDGHSLFHATRPTGAPDPVDACMLDEWADVPATGQPFPVVPPPPAEIPSKIKYRLMMRRSQRPAALGNVVRAAICHARAALCAPAEFAGRVRSAIKMDLDHLIRRLQAALELKESSPQAWQESLLPLVEQTPRGIWTVEARLLYDLQKVCVDHEREIYTVDLVEWALSRGRRPVKRHLPSQRDVLMLKHLHSAAKRLAAVRISDDQRRQLATLIREATERIESRLRERLRPRIVAALDEVGLKAQNLPERVARKKIVEELLDQICDRGFLALGDLRDAISRNSVKLPDLSDWFQFIHGDRLLRADRRLSLALDGVYRRGEIYLRWMQRASSVGFGTPVGRFLTRFAVVPFGGSFVTVVGIHAIWQMITGQETHHDLRYYLAYLSSPTVLVLGVFLLCLLNFPAFQKWLANSFSASYRALRFVIVAPIRWIVDSPWLQHILRSRTFRLLFRLAMKPLFWTGMAWCVLPARFWRDPAWTGTVIFLTASLLLNSRAGRTLEELLVDGIVEAWRRFGLRPITGLFWLIYDVFRRIVQTVERLMYGVDEWLRFRTGESRRLLTVKAAVGLLWFFVAYVLRFAVNVLIEPQFNPIKHFPVVTVAHKMLFAAYVPFTRLLMHSFGIGKYEAGTIATAIIWCIPGVFGFLVWELKENWRLYAANRRRDLRPIPIGSHGETMMRLLRPGFHSGTLPKRYAKLRRAERHARADGDWHAVPKHLRLLHHVEQSIRRCVEREFLELLAESTCWNRTPVTLREVRLATNRVRLCFGCREIGEQPLTIEIDTQSGWLLAGASGPSWADHLAPSQRQVFVTALIGLFKIAGIELIRQQIESEFPAPPPWYDLSPAGLVLWPDDQREVEVLYDLHEGPWIAPLSVSGLSPRRLPTVERARLLLTETPVAWQRWLDVWEQDAAGHGHPRDPLVPVKVL
jgi:hypothetical protein